MKKPSPKPGRATCGKPELVNSDFTTGGRNMQGVSPVTQFGEQANKIAASVQTGDDNILTLWQMCHRYAMQQVT